MRNFKLSWRRGIFIAVSVAVLALSIPNIGSASAVLTAAHSLYTAWRFEREVLRDTRVGQYYEGLIFKHAPEAIDLLLKDPNHKEKFIALGENTIPLLDGYLNGQGDSAMITAASMDALSAILDDLSVASSPSMQSDIRIEYERFPLDRFVGMSMNDAYAYVLESFVGELAEPAVVEGTGGKWAYYIHDDVYFEYPSNWYVQEMEISREGNSTIIIIPCSENPSDWDSEWLVLGITKGADAEVAFKGDFTFNTNGYDVLWTNSIQAAGMNGIEYAAKYQLTALIAAELYDPDGLIFVDAGVILLDPFGTQLDDTSPDVQQCYEYFYHLISSLRIMH